uniref:AtPDCT1/2 transmembrane domain-containing protein n=1 Tax=Oryza barthii TaxID=65489 RepID=A0A0D3GII2_9ORYZ
MPPPPPPSLTANTASSMGNAEAVVVLPANGGARRRADKLVARWRGKAAASAAAARWVGRRRPELVLGGGGGGGPAAAPGGGGVRVRAAAVHGPWSTPIPMVPPAAPPVDLGFAATAALHAGIAARPWLNSLLAALNTVFVAMQAAYILWAILGEGRPRAAVAAMMMFTCRGALGCATQLPLPAEFLGSGMDFPVGNVSFFLFFSGHVAGAVIAAEDMRRAGRRGMARLYDALNLLQGVRLLACRGHYTIDLAVGVGAGLLFDMLAGRYLDGKNAVDGRAAVAPGSRCCSCHKALLSQ